MHHTNHTTTTDIDSVFVSNGGRVACHRHLGGYATAELRRRPNARTISTPLDVWGRVDQIDVDAQDWAWMNCESCPNDETTDDTFSTKLSGSAPQQRELSATSEAALTAAVRLRLRRVTPHAPLAAMCSQVPPLFGSSDEHLSRMWS